MARWLLSLTRRRPSRGANTRSARCRSEIGSDYERAVAFGPPPFPFGAPPRYNPGMDEFGIIAKYFAPLAGEGAFGLKDDAAILPARAGHELIVTTDTIAEGTDFFPSDPPDTIAQ